MTDLTFNQKYRMQTVKEKKEMYNDDGSVTTVRSGGVPYNGKIYNVPLYDRDYVDKDYKRGRILTQEQALKKWKPMIEKGMIKGYDEKFDGDIHDHPAKVAARKEHKMMDEWSRQK